MTDPRLAGDPTSQKRKLFAREGAKVIIAGRDQATLDTRAQSIGKGADAIHGDICTMSTFTRRVGPRHPFMYAGIGN
ncbi:hypothetical protein [Bradyrhizobium sp. Cp5.3]|uniref:hypothetical protein n=1 Tax=Bradyrhizobium sp. Cp5.3 TaxID=443598 RepID=UPI0003FB2627|nr:hypothetical protein [Bradyrhizobium sp. Cp5.3]